MIVADNTLQIEGQQFSIVGEAGDAFLIDCNLCISSLILDKSFFLKGERILAGGNDLGYIRHGTNTYSLFSPAGGWVIAGPSRGIVRSVLQPAIESGAILACANVESQWLFGRTTLGDATKRMAEVICKLIPAFDSMPPDRKDTVTCELSDLCYCFAEEGGGKIDRFTHEDILWDTTPGLIIIPKSIAREEKIAISFEAIEKLSNRHDLSHDTLVYWWESIFTAWWKGFW